MNSFDRLSNLFAGGGINKPAPTDEDGENEDDDVDMLGTGTRNESLSVGKDDSKIPMKKSKSIFVAVSGAGFLKFGVGLSPSATTLGGRYCLTSDVVQ